jgi:hypothetical protein
VVVWEGHPLQNIIGCLCKYIEDTNWEKVWQLDHLSTPLELVPSTVSSVRDSPWGKANQEVFYQSDSDFKVLRTVGGNNEFLLPRSPSYSTIVSDGIAIFSFPDVKSFLKNVRRELSLESGSERSKIWDMHKATMSVYIRNAEEEHERASMQTGLISASLEERIRIIKQTLFDELVTCFKVFDSNNNTWNTYYLI